MNRIRTKFLIVMTMLMGLASSCSDDGVSELCFVGDSLVAGWDVKSSFPTRVVRNDGVSGAHLEDILTWNLDYQGKDVVMLIGTNNLGYESTSRRARSSLPILSRSIDIRSRHWLLVVSLSSQSCHGVPRTTTRIFRYISVN